MISRFLKVAATKRAASAMLALVWAGTASAATISGHVADYNAAQVATAHGVLVVPAGLVTYTAGTTLTTGTEFTVTLPGQFRFGSVPSLTTSGAASFTLSSGGTGRQSATFTLGTADLPTAGTISLAGFTVDNAFALEAVTPVEYALRVTMQALWVDPAALSFGAFASDVGAFLIFVGAIQFIDVSPPSNGTEFGLGGNDSLTAVYSATVIRAQTTDAATGTVPMLGANGLPNTLRNTDTATITMYGSFAGIGQVFSSPVSDCTQRSSTGRVGYGNVTIPNVPINTEVFFCVVGDGQIIGVNLGGLRMAAAPGSSTDFLAAEVLDEFPGLDCYGDTGYGCVNFSLVSIFTPSPLILSAPGLIPITIAATSTFNAAAVVNRASLTFGVNGGEHSIASCTPLGASLVCYFDSHLAGFEPTGNNLGILNGQTQAGSFFQGTQTIRILR